jgi:hypothetical protein
MKGLIRVADDFDDPMPDNIISAFEDGPVFPDR